MSTCQEPLTISRYGINIHLHMLPRVDIERPKQFRYPKKQIPLREMNPGTQSPTRPIAIMIAQFGIRRRSELGSEFGDTEVVVWIED
jgi:hypothetical protein